MFTIRNMVFHCIFLGKKAIIITSKHGTKIFFPLQSYSKKTLRKNVPKSARKYKRNVLMPPWASYNTSEIELIQYGRRIGKKVYYFKSLSIGLASEIEPATSHYAVNRFIDWANPAA